MSFDLTNIALLVCAATLAGAVNAAAGGGSLISFPVLLLVGLPALSANVTNTVALCPGYLGGTVGYRPELEGQGDLMRRLTVFSVAGAVAGVVLLQISSPDTFRSVVPFLLLAGCLLLVCQKPLAAWIFRHHHRGGDDGPISAARDVGTLAAAAYGAYFGAALGVAIVAPVHWLAVAVMLPASLLGGRGGAVVARHIPTPYLRGGVAAVGIAVAVLLLVGV